MTTVQGRTYDRSKHTLDGIIDTVIIPMLFKTVASKKIDSKLLVTDHCTLDDILEAYKTFGHAANTKALTVIISAYGGRQSTPGKYHGRSWQEQYTMKAMALVTGVISALLGGLWLLQGLGVVQVQPILCFAVCEPLQGASLTWAITGFVTATVGASLTTLSLLGLFSSRATVTPTVEFDSSLEFVELQGYRFHVRTFGSKTRSPLIIVHGGPGGDSKYLTPLQNLAKDNYVIFYDQRGTGLSPRVKKETLTLESSLNDLHAIVSHYGARGEVKLIGHSWGAMLVVGYLGRHPERVSHAVVVEPGMLNPRAAKEFARRFKASQSAWDMLPLLRYVLVTPFVSSRDGHERNDYVMTRLLNRTKPGGPYQCEGEAMPPNAFERAGYAAFDTMLKPVLEIPESFDQNLVLYVAGYKGKLLMLSSECSFIGYKYQEEFHIPFLPAQTEHLEAKAMGHNMLTINPAWSMAAIARFLCDGA